MYKKAINKSKYSHLVSEIRNILSQARRNIASTVNSTMVITNWNIGRYIVEFEQDGKERAEYGTQLLKRLSEDLTKVYGRGFSYRNLSLMKQFYPEFPIWQTVSAKSDLKKVQTPSAQFNCIYPIKKN